MWHEVTFFAGVAVSVKLFSLVTDFGEDAELSNSESFLNVSIGNGKFNFSPAVLQDIEADKRQDQTLMNKVVEGGLFVVSWNNDVVIDDGIAERAASESQSFAGNGTR